MSAREAIGSDEGSVAPQHLRAPMPSSRSEGYAAAARPGWGRLLRRTRQKFVADRVSMSAGSLAYHGFLALFPAVVALLGVLAVAHAGAAFVAHLIHALAKALPSSVAGVISEAVRSATTRGAGSWGAVGIGTAIALWSALGAMSALQQALDVAYGVPVDRKYFARRLWAVPLSVATVVLGGAGAALAVLGAPIGSAIEGHAPVHGTAFVVVWTALRWILAFVLVSVLFTLYYALGPNRKAPRWRWLSVGGVGATAVFLAASLGFSAYTTRFGSYSKTYGTFAGVAILIFWLYLSGLAVLLGGELNAQIERHAAAVGTPVSSRRRRRTRVRVAPREVGGYFGEPPGATPQP